MSPRFRVTNRPIIPGTLTAGNMFCGFLSIANSFQGNYLTASWLIILAAVFDALDGMIARLTRSYSKFGIEFDSMSDVISFGAAPAVLIYAAHFQTKGFLGLVIAFFPLLFGAIRLARFNVMQKGFDKENFVGLPIPIQATALASYLIFTDNLWGTLRFPMLFAAYVIFLGFLMVSHIEYETMPKFTIKKDRQNTIKLMLFVSASLIIIFFPRETIFPFSLIFILTGFFRGVLQHGEETDEEFVDLS